MLLALQLKLPESLEAPKIARRTGRAKDPGQVRTRQMALVWTPRGDAELGHEFAMLWGRVEDARRAEEHVQRRQRAGAGHAVQAPGAGLRAGGARAAAEGLRGQEPQPAQRGGPGGGGAARAGLGDDRPEHGPAAQPAAGGRLLVRAAAREERAAAGLGARRRSRRRARISRRCRTWACAARCRAIRWFLEGSAHEVLHALLPGGRADAGRRGRGQAALHHRPPRLWPRGAGGGGRGLQQQGPGGAAGAQAGQPGRLHPGAGGHPPGVRGAARAEEPRARAQPRPQRGEGAQHVPALRLQHGVP